MQVLQPASGAALHRGMSSYKSGRLEECEVPHDLQTAKQRSDSLASIAAALPGSVPTLRRNSARLGKAGATSEALQPEAQQPSARQSSADALDEVTTR